MDLQWFFVCHCGPKFVIVVQNDWPHQNGQGHKDLRGQKNTDEAIVKTSKLDGGGNSSLQFVLQVCRHSVLDCANLVFWPDWDIGLSSGAHAYDDSNPLRSEKPLHHVINIKVSGFGKLQLPWFVGTSYRPPWFFQQKLIRNTRRHGQKCERHHNKPPFGWPQWPCGCAIIVQKQQFFGLVFHSESPKTAPFESHSSVAQPRYDAKISIRFLA